MFVRLKQSLLAYLPPLCMAPPPISLYHLLPCSPRVPSIVTFQLSFIILAFNVCTCLPLTLCWIQIHDFIHFRIALYPTLECWPVCNTLTTATKKGTKGESPWVGTGHNNKKKKCTKVLVFPSLAKSKKKKFAEILTPLPTHIRGACKQGYESWKHLGMGWRLFQKVHTSSLLNMVA